MTEAEITTRILLVDDRQAELSALEATLSDLGSDFQMVKAQSGEEALEHLLQGDFAVILLDSRMPGGMDGLETAQMIRKSPRFKHTPIIFLSGYDKSDIDVMQGYGIGAVDYIFKPVDEEILKAKVGTFIEIQRKNAEVQRQAIRLRQMEQQQFEQKLKEERQMLELQAARALKEKNKQLSQANEDLREFSMIVAHDLKAPLRSIAHWTRDLREVCEKRLETDELESLDRIEESLTRLDRLITDLLHFSRAAFETRDIEKKVQLGSVVRRVLDALDGLIGEQGAQVDVGWLPTLKCNPTSFEQVFQNLIGNSLKFKKPDVALKIKIEGEILSDSELEKAFPTQKVKKAVRIFVSDNGIGMDENQAARVFRIFHKLNADQFEGSGVGLAICRRIIERMNGTIVAGGEPGKGALFTITLPMEEA